MSLVISTSIILCHINLLNNFPPTAFFNHFGKLMKILKTTVLGEYV